MRDNLFKYISLFLYEPLRNELIPTSFKTSHLKGKYLFFIYFCTFIILFSPLLYSDLFSYVAVENARLSLAAELAVLQDVIRTDKARGIADQVRT